MKHKEKIEWMIKWAHKNKVRLELEGECGFGRKCVGIVADIVGYPDYYWFDDDYTQRIDNNGDVWLPLNAYHKHPCVAVLGRGEPAEDQLYIWLKWFDDNDFIVELGDKDLSGMEKRNLVPTILLGKHRFARMAKKKAAAS